MNGRGGAELSRSILISDGEQRSALATVRSLGRRGYSVFVCSTSGRSIAGASRYATAERHVSAPLANPSRFAQDVANLIAEWKIDLFLPITEESFNAVFAHSDLFRGVCIPAASADQFRAVSDKKRVLELAASSGLDVPAQVVISAPGSSSGTSLAAFPSGVRGAHRHIGDALTAPGGTHGVLWRPQSSSCRRTSRGICGPDIRGSSAARWRKLLRGSPPAPSWTWWRKAASSLAAITIPIRTSPSAC